MQYRGMKKYIPVFLGLLFLTPQVHGECMPGYIFDTATGKQCPVATSNIDESSLLSVIDKLKQTIKELRGQISDLKSEYESSNSKDSDRIKRVDIMEEISKVTESLQKLLAEGVCERGTIGSESCSLNKETLEINASNYREQRADLYDEYAKLDDDTNKNSHDDTRYKKVRRDLVSLETRSTKTQKDIDKVNMMREDLEMELILIRKNPDLTPR